MANLIQDIKPRGIASAYIVAPFDEGKELLEKEGYNIISLQKNAKLRIQEGVNENISKNGNWVREGVLYVPKKGKFLTKISPIMANAKRATDCHRNGKDFYLTSEQIEESLSDSVELSKDSIPTNRFAEDEITVYAFGDIAEQYGKFLKEAEINEMHIWTADLQDKPFARQMWFGFLAGGSGLDGSRNLYYGSRVRGVCEDASASEPNKISGTYNSKQIKNILNKEGITGELEKRILAGLNQKLL